MRRQRILETLWPLAVVALIVDIIWMIASPQMWQVVAWPILVVAIIILTEKIEKF